MKNSEHILLSSLTRTKLSFHVERFPAQAGYPSIVEVSFPSRGDYRHARNHFKQLGFALEPAPPRPRFGVHGRSFIRSGDLIADIFHSTRTDVGAMSNE